MSDNSRRWNTFIGWAQRFYAWPDFAREEREYKLAIGQQLHDSKEALRAGSPAWQDMLAEAVNDKDNNLDWHVKKPFVTWCLNQPQEAASALTHLWDETVSVQVRVQQFMEEVPGHAVRGMHDMFTSFLLMALDATRHPMYRTEAYQMAYRLTDSPGRPKHGAGAVYQHALDFLDRLLTEAHQRGLPLRDRLDAQSVLWCVTWYKVTDSPVSDWPEVDRQALLAYRGDPDHIEPIAGQVVWLFQYDPAYYDLLEYVRDHGLCDDWQASQRQSDMRVGQRVYFLRTGGPLAALVAVGRIVSPVYPDSESAEQSSQGSQRQRVDVLYEARVEPPLTRQEHFRSDATLTTYVPVYRGQQGTNFVLPPEVARRLENLVRDRLTPFEVVAPELTDLGAPDVPTHLDARTRVLAAVVRRQGQPEFRQRLIEAYAGRCAVTDCDAVDALEAAHIAPYLGPRTNDVTNGLLLRADIHTLFDLGLLGVDTRTMAVVLAPSLAHTVYGDLAGQALRLPRIAMLHPSKPALDEHRRRAGL
jgi:hypothetical protein